MGEWSKSIGEKGEKIVKFIFEDILEFNSLIENTTIECIKGAKHKNKTAKNDRTTHGLDGLLYLESPTQDELLDIVLISSKYMDAKYPENPKTLFKSHLKDLAFTIECFKNSRRNNEINQKFNSVNKTEITGVLVWLSNKDAIDYDLTSKVNNIKIDSDLLFDKIILIDNNRANFIYESIYRTQETHGKDNVSFVYHNSGLNYSSEQYSMYGKKFPVNYLYSEIIPLRVEHNHNEVSLIIFVKDDFSKENFSQILTFAKTFDRLNAIKKTVINYKSYDDLTGTKDIKDVLIDFPNYNLDNNLIIGTFPSNYRSQ